MSDSNRGVLATLAGIAALAVATGAGAYYGSLYSPAKKQYPSVGANQSADDPYQGVTESLPDIAFIPDPVERAIANPPPNSGEDHEKRDLAAQETMAVWAFYMALFSGVTALITGLGTYFIAKQVKLTREAVESTGEATVEMRIANRIAEKALAENKKSSVSQLRPYVVVTTVAILDGMTKPDRMFAEAVLTNVGQTPAFYAYGENQFGFSPSLDLLRVLEPVPVMGNGSKTIIPKDKPVRFVTECAGPSDRMVATVKSGKGLFFVRGWKRYQDVFGNRYQTDYLYILTQGPFLAGTGFSAAPFGNEMS